MNHSQFRSGITQLFLCPQLAEIMRRDVPKIRISTVEIETVGVCLRYVPLECAHGQ